MKIKLKTSMSGPEGTHGPGEELDVENAYAKRLLDSGQAEAVGKKPVERAEKTSKSSSKKKTTARKRTAKKG